MDGDGIKFSIIVPAHNTAPYLNACVNSIVKQDYGNWEAIFIDDGSTDGTSEALDNFCDQDTRIRVVHKICEGVSVARNVGLELACGEWICFLDSDDEYSADLLRRIDELLKRNVNFDIVRFCYDVVMDDGRVDSTTSQELRCGMFSGEQILGGSASALGMCAWNCWDKVYRRTFLIGHGIKFDQEMSIGEDTLFATRCLSLAQKVLCTNIRGYRYRRRNGSASVVAFEKSRESLIRSFTLLHEMWESNLTAGRKACLLNIAVRILFLPNRMALVHSSVFDKLIVPFLLYNGKLKGRLFGFVYRFPVKWIKIMLLKII